FSLVRNALQRIDLNRPLPDYPAPDSTSGQITNVAGFMCAQTARQQFAQDIFAVLLNVTMGRSYDPTPSTGGIIPALTAGTPDYDAARWLAQLAVNMVDFVDNDDYMTPFFWNPATPSDVVLGPELHRLVINEAYVEWTNSASPTNVSVWVELLNTSNSGDPTLPVPPVTATPPAAAGDIALGTTGIPAIYQVLLCQRDP